jgi:hypothetical protein
MTFTDIVKCRKTNDYENFKKGMIYMKILKKGGSREKGGGGNEIHVPVSKSCQIIENILKYKKWLLKQSYVQGNI